MVADRSDPSDRADRSDKSDSALARLLAVLDLFDEQHLHWTPDAVADALGVSRPTAYRYVRLLVDAGLLQRSADARLSPGPRIVVLDHLMRQADPLLQPAVPLMKELVAQTGFDAVMSALVGRQLLDTHREHAAAPADLSYGRGRPRPLFLGAAPKVILAQLPPAALHKLFDGHAAEAVAAGLPADWPAFRRHFARIRKAGHYLSRGELEPALAGLAAPVVAPDGQVAGALSLVGPVARMEVMDAPKLAQRVMRAAREIGARLG